MPNQFWEEINIAYNWAMAGDLKSALPFFGSALVALGRV